MLILVKFDEKFPYSWPKQLFTIEKKEGLIFIFLFFNFQKKIKEKVQKE